MRFPFPAAPARRLALALLAISTLAIACSGGGGDDDDAGSSTPTPTPTVTALPGSVPEIEPNDSAATGTALPAGATVPFDGVCANQDDLDWFTFTGAPGPIAVSVAWTEGDEPADLDVVVVDSAGTFELSNVDVPPGDSPADVSGTLPTAGSYFIVIDCYNTTLNVFWQGTLTR